MAFAYTMHCCIAHCTGRQDHFLSIILQNGRPRETEATAERPCMAWGGASVVYMYSSALKHMIIIIRIIVRDDSLMLIIIMLFSFLVYD